MTSGDEQDPRPSATRRHLNRAHARRDLAQSLLLLAALALTACGGKESADPGEPPATAADAAAEEVAAALPVPAAETPASPAPAPMVTEPVLPPEPAIVPELAPVPAPQPDAAPTPAAMPPPEAPPPAIEPLPAAPEMEAPTDLALRERIAAADIAAGEAYAARCAACHTFVVGAAELIGPNLYDIVGAAVGRADGFNYSTAMQALNAEGALWTFERLDAFLTIPAVAVPGTRMGFAGIASETDRANVVAYLRSLSDRPVPLVAAGTEADDAEPRFAAATFTTEQVGMGRDFYGRECVLCHGANLGGIWYGAEWGDAPPLAGDRFAAVWFARSLYDFLTHMRSAAIGNAYPYSHDTLTPERYADLIAYILERNGFLAGETPLPTDRETLEGMGFRQ